MKDQEEVMKKLFTLLAALACMGLMAAPASAVQLTDEEKKELKEWIQKADWDLYGSARIGTWWTNYSEQARTNPEPGDSHTEMTGWDHGNARIGAKVQLDGLSGRFEYGSGDGYDNANLRQLYGAAEVGPGKALVGKTYTPLDEAVGISMQSGNIPKTAGMKKYMGYSGRRPQLKYTIDNFKMAFMSPENKVNNANVQFPQMEAAYSMATKALKWNLSAAFLTYDMDHGEGETLTAYSVAPRVTVNALKPLIVSLAGYYGQNVSQLHQRTVVEAGYNVAAEEDTTTYSGTATIRYPIKAVTFEAGGGYQESQNDEWKETDNAMKTYVLARVPISQNGHFFVQPEVGYKDYMDGKDGNNQGDETYVGAEWRINF